MCLRSFGLYCSACLGILLVSPSVSVLVTFPGTVLFPLLYSLLLFFPNILGFYFILFCYSKKVS